MNPTSTPYENGLRLDLQDPAEAAAYLNAAIEDGDQQVFLLALRDVVEAQGMTQTARAAGLNRENLYRIRSVPGNP